jgi:hypothetical protein
MMVTKMVYSSPSMERNTPLSFRRLTRSSVADFSLIVNAAKAGAMSRAQWL